MGIFDPLKKLLKEAEPTAARLAEASADARRIETEASAEVSRLSDAIKGQLTVDDATRAKTRDALRAAREKAEDAGLFAAELEARRVGADAAEEQHRRQAAYAAAKALSDDAAKTLRKEYPRLATALLKVVRTLAEAQIAVRDANASLPAGAEPLLDPEMTVRATPGLPRKVISEEEVELWCFGGSTNPVGDQKRVSNSGGGRGYVPAGPGTAGNIFVERRSFKRVQFLPETYADYPAPLDTELRLPGFFEPQLRSPFGTDPASTITGIDAALSATPADPSARRPSVELIYISKASKAAA